MKESPSRANNPLHGEGEFPLLGIIAHQSAMRLGRSFKFGAASALEQMEEISIDKLPKNL